MSLEDNPFTAAKATAFAGAEKIPVVKVKPFDAVNNPVLLIVFDVNAPVFVIDPDDKAPVLVIVLDVKSPVLVIVLDVNVFKVDGPKTFNDDVSQTAWFLFQKYFY